ncbi:MAG TPA: glutamate--tRNA ligase [Candidatus Eisenbacteria bacterium]|nr:glutamate--tRNA ligase [Candidatus Eisenbacteria bacterium]
MVRTRIAPSPTGYPHIGTIYQALFDWAFAKKNNGIFFVRIEDTDRARLVEDAEEKIFAALDWFGLGEGESPRKGGPYEPYRQSERLEIYQKYAKELLEKGGAYYCFCSKERLEEVHSAQEKEHKATMYDKHCRNLSKDEVQQKLKEGIGYVIRLKIPENTDIVVKDEIRGEIHFDSNLIEDTVLMKSDGYPTYHLASAVVDDHLMQTSHLVRGEEWLSSLPKHWVLYDYFGWEKPLFFHTPVLRNPDKSKLSKRQGHTNVSWYQEEGFLPEAILNYLAQLSWSHPEGKDIFSLDEFISLMDLKDIKPVGPIFDIVKLSWLNGQYIQAMELKALSEKLKAFYHADSEVLKILESKQNNALLELAKTRMKTLKEFKELVIPIKAELSPEEKEVANVFRQKLEAITDWNKDAILNVVREVIKEKKIKGSMLYKVTTGYEHGLPLPESLEILGKEAILERLQ